MTLARFVRQVACWVLALLLLLLPVQALAFETTAPTAILLDFSTGRILYEKNADKRIAPASLSKLMTVAVLFDALRSGRDHRRHRVHRLRLRLEDRRRLVRRLDHVPAAAFQGRASAT